MQSSGNWVVDNIVNALNTWNEKMAEIWQLVSQSPQNFKGGTVWRVIEGIHNSLVAVGLALLVLFFVMMLPLWLLWGVTPWQYLSRMGRLF